VNLNDPWDSEPIAVDAPGQVDHGQQEDSDGHAPSIKRAQFRFYAELNYFLPPRRQQRTVAHRFSGRVSVKDMIESQGVPHTEVDLILVNGVSKDFDYLVQDEDRISVYPVFESIDITPIVRLRPNPLREPRFVLDTHLGKLATYLRMLGFDSLYWNDAQDDVLAEISSQEGRILLTRDRGLLMRSVVTHGYYVRATDPRKQLVEVLQRFDLVDSVRPFRRCIRCNGLLHQVPKEAIRDRLPPKTREYYDEFRVCDQCGQIYWEGSHYDRMQAFIARILERAKKKA
jgi:uncharacterized protein with PIN domain